MAAISVLVPIYNVEKYLRQCLDSLRQQTEGDLQVILVDDGSTDASSEICDEFAQADARFLVIHKPNSGYGDSMNRALELAEGEWVAIVEPDDWTEPTMMADLLSAARAYDGKGTPVDLVKGDYLREVADAQGQVTQLPSAHSTCVHPQAQPFTIAGCTDLLHLHPSIWTCLYRRSFLDAHGIRFQPAPGAGWADNPFFLETMVAAHAMAYVPKPVYHYREFEDGTLSHLRDWRIIVDRWADMDQVLQKYQVSDVNVLEAHYCRGCAYLQMLQHDFDGNDPQLKDRARQMAESMDIDIICASHLVPKHYRFAYASFLPAGKRAKVLASWVAMQAKARL